jgi:short-subunit dehydrogenase
LSGTGGAIINLGSIASDMAIPLQGMYSASKHAIRGFTEQPVVVIVRDFLQAPVEGDAGIVDPGVEAAEALQRAGARVVLAARNAEALATIQEEIEAAGGEATHVRLSRR